MGSFIGFMRDLLTSKLEAKAKKQRTTTLACFSFLGVFFLNKWELPKDLLENLV